MGRQPVDIACRNAGAKQAPAKMKKETLLCHEFKIARCLAGNNIVMRKKALRGLRKWLEHRSRAVPFTEEDFVRLWKGLFYSMWMSDKFLVQEECAENIAKLCRILKIDSALLFYQCGLEVLSSGWNGIDQLRLNKFQMLVRRMLRHILARLKKTGWKDSKIKKFGKIIHDFLESTAKNCLGFALHLIEIYLEEVAKVSKGVITTETVTALLRPFIRQLASGKESRYLGHIRKHIFKYLMEQSDLGLEYSGRFRAWQKAGCPGTSVDSMVRVESDDSDDDVIEVIEITDDTDDEIPLDPRAGRVDVELAQLPFDAKRIAHALRHQKFKDYTCRINRKHLEELATQFEKLHSGTYPLGQSQAMDLNLRNSRLNIRQAVNSLDRLEQDLRQETSQKRKRSKDSDKAESPSKKQRSSDGNPSGGKRTATETSPKSKGRFGSSEGASTSTASAGPGEVLGGSSGNWIIFKSKKEEVADDKEQPADDQVESSQSGVIEIDENEISDEAQTESDTEEEDDDDDGVAELEGNYTSGNESSSFEAPTDDFSDDECCDLEFDNRQKKKKLAVYTLSAKFSTAAKSGNNPGPSGINKFKRKGNPKTDQAKRTTEDESIASTSKGQSGKRPKENSDDENKIEEDESSDEDSDVPIAIRQKWLENRNTNKKIGEGSGEEAGTSQSKRKIQAKRSVNVVEIEEVDENLPSGSRSVPKRLPPKKKRANSETASLTSDQMDYSSSDEESGPNKKRALMAALTKQSPDRRPTKIKFNLKRNSIQEVSDYKKLLKKTPKVTYDPAKVPKRSILKPDQIRPQTPNPF